MSSQQRPSPISRLRAGFIAMVVGLSVPGTWAQAASTDLSFDQALEIAEGEAPRLIAGQASVDAAGHAVDPADALPDPTAFIGANAVPIEGDQRFEFSAEPMTMQVIGFRQAWPNRTKRSARRALALAELERSLAELDVDLAHVRRETAAAWIERYHVEKGLELFEAWEKETRLLIDAVTALIEGGRTRGSDALLARRELLKVAELRDRQQARVEAARARLGEWIGDAAELRLMGEPPRFEPAAGRLEHRLHEHPELLLFTSLAAQAHARIDAAEAEKRPDWEVELGYQRRPGFGDMVSFQVSADLPLFTRHRQDPLIDAERKRAVAIEAERASAYRRHRAELEADLAEYHRLEREVRRLKEQTLPLMGELVDLRFAEYRGGEGALTDLVEARQALLETRLELIDRESARGSLGAILRYAYLEN